MAKNYNYVMPYHDGWKKLSGALPVRLTNDYLFRALMQADEKTLRAMVVSLLHMKEDEMGVSFRFH